MTTRSRALHIARQTILSLLLLGIGGAAFRLSYDAQVKLAIVAGVTGNLAGLYPIIVDAVILLTTLIRIWNKPEKKAGRVYIWIALGVWTATSVLGNAFHVVALPAAEVRIPLYAAIAVNTVPALSLFVAIHLATTMAFRPTVVERPRSTRQKLVSAGVMTVNEARTITTTTDADLLRMADIDRMSVREIAARIGIGKTAVANRLNRIRESDELAS